MAMFSPSVATSWETASPTLSVVRSVAGSSVSSAGSPARVSPKASCAEIWSPSDSENARISVVRATKSVSRFTSTRTAALGVTRATTRPSDATRSAFRAAAASPFLRRIFLASSKSPPDSTSAFLQSIIPTPVSARSRATSFELISMIPRMTASAVGYRPPAWRTAASGGSLRRVGDDGGLRELRRTRALFGRGRLFRHALLVGVKPLENRVGDPGCEETDRADRVVVARDHVVDDVRIAVRVHDGHDRDAQDVRFLDRDVLLFRVDDEERVGQLVHLLDPGQVLLELLLLALEAEALFLRQVLVVFLRENSLDFLQPVDRLADRREIREGPAEPPRVHEKHSAAVRLFVDRVLRLPFRSDEQEVLSGGGELGHEFRGILELLQGLLQVDDVDAVALPEDELLHLGVPSLCLVPEVHARFEQFLHRDRDQETPPLSAGFRPARARDFTACWTGTGPARRAGRTACVRSSAGGASARPLSCASCGA